MMYKIRNVYIGYVRVYIEKFYVLFINCLCVMYFTVCIMNNVISMCNE